MSAENIPQSEVIETQAPGKLYIAGEYAVVEPGNPAVLVAVDRFITVRLSESADLGLVHSSEYGRMPVVWRRDPATGSVVVEHHPYDYVTSAINTVERLREERGIDPKYFDLHITSQLDDSNGQKFGLGSSAAVVVATVAAIDQFYGLQLSTMERFKIALLATVAVSPASSGGDIAASTFGGWICYSSPNRDSLRRFAEEHSITESLTAAGWDPFAVQRLPEPSAVKLRVGWTGSPASTEELVGSVQHSSPADSPQYTTFLRESRAMVTELTEALSEDSETAESAMRLIRTARSVLVQLQSSSGITIETQQLTELCEIAEAHGAAGKPSGAGGGDCGIVLTCSNTDLDGLYQDWEEHQIRPLPLTVYGAQR